MSRSNSCLAQGLSARIAFNSKDETFSESTIFFDPAYPGFAGHFEGNPVVPGVCLFQWVRVHMEQVLEWDLELKEISQCRFRRPLLAGTTGTCRIKLLSRHEKTVQIQADIFADGESACRIKANLEQS